MTIRVYAPVGGDTREVFGKTYKAAEGSYLDVTNNVADVLLNNGWLTHAEGGVGATAARPTKPKKNDKFFDSTVGAVIVYDGKNWRSTSTGAVV